MVEWPDQNESHTGSRRECVLSSRLSCSSTYADGKRTKFTSNHLHDEELEMKAEISTRQLLLSGVRLHVFYEIISPPPSPGWEVGMLEERAW